MKKINLNLLILILFSLTVNAQKIKIKEGTLSSLSKIKSYDVKFSYENMNVGKITENEYLEEKVAEKNKKAKGTGDKWKKEWTSNRSRYYEPKFIELFNKHTKGALKIKKGDVRNTKVMFIETLMTEPGYNAGITRKDGSVTLKITFKEKEADKVLAVIHVIKADGEAMGYKDFDTKHRIMEAYAKAGKELAQFLRKKAL